jgi:hypothetical protein
LQFFSTLDDRLLTSKAASRTCYSRDDCICSAVSLSANESTPKCTHHDGNVICTGGVGNDIAEEVVDVAEVVASTVATNQESSTDSMTDNLTAMISVYSIQAPNRREGSQSERNEDKPRRESGFGGESNLPRRE